MSDTPTFAEQFEEANQSIIAEGLRKARREGRAAGPEMFTPDHSTFQPIEGVIGARLFVRGDLHAGLENKPLRGFKDSEYGG